VGGVAFDRGPNPENEDAKTKKQTKNFPLHHHRQGPSQ